MLVTACADTTGAAAPDHARTPVLFVHGHGLSSGTWRAMMARLTSVGYPPAYLGAVDIVPNTMSNERAAMSVIEPAAAALLVAATAAARSAGYGGKVPQRLDIVSHSMGAASSRWYASRLRPERVRMWITLAGANHGTNSLCGLSDQGAGEMCPAFSQTARESAFQVALNGTPSAPLDETPYGVGADRPGVRSIPPDGSRRILYFTIRIEPDRWIKPERSALLNGAGGKPVQVPSGVLAEETSPGNFLFRQRATHDDLPGHPDLIRLVIAMLSLRE